MLALRAAALDLVLAFADLDTCPVCAPVLSEIGFTIRFVGIFFVALLESVDHILAFVVHTWLATLLQKLQFGDDLLHRGDVCRLALELSYIAYFIHVVAQVIIIVVAFIVVLNIPDNILVVVLLAEVVLS